MTLNKFANELAQLHNKHGLLYCDMIDQDTLFEIQSTIANLLILGYESGKISKKTMEEFKHVFNFK